MQVIFAVADFKFPPFLDRSFAKFTDKRLCVSTEYTQLKVVTCLPSLLSERPTKYQADFFGCR